MPESPITHCYPDTEDGVRAMLSSLFIVPSWEGAVFTPDPECFGVWFVEWSNGTNAIAYLAGYGLNDYNDASFSD